MSKRKRESVKTEGVCKLTGLRGRYLNSHIMPRALTEQTWNGKPLVQPGPHGKLIERWSSWYDKELCTAAGEGVLASYDDWGIRFFRDHRMIWSSWNGATVLEAPDHVVLPDGRAGLRMLKGVDTDRLRVFLLSILWRAAQSNLVEMGAVQLSVADLEKLRIMVLYGLPMPYDFFPVQITQLYTRNFPHNQAPYVYSHELKRRKWWGKIVVERERPHFRFWMDGLTLHFYQNEPADFVAKNKMFVGNSDELRITTIPSERSRQMRWFWSLHTGRDLKPHELAKIRDDLHLVD